MKRKVLIFMLAMLLGASSAYAGTLGHYYPGVMGMRDIILPPKGFYALYYDPIYGSNAMTNSHGHKIDAFSASETETKVLNIQGQQIPVTLTANLSAKVKMSMFFTMQELLLVWVPGWKFLGADFGMMIVPSMGFVDVRIKANAHTAGTLTVADKSEILSKDSEFKLDSSKYGFGDLLVQPVMLDWRGKKFDLGVNYGFFAPTGAYSEHRIANVGMGFWSQQFQAFGSYYFDKERKNAAVAVVTYNLNSKMYSKDLTPGQSITLEYGFDHYFNSRIAAGPCGYSQWQISSDTGTAAVQKNVFYQIHGIGGQLSGWLLKEKLNITGKCIAEYYGVGRFRGVLGTVNLIYIF